MSFRVDYFAAGGKPGRDQKHADIHFQRRLCSSLQVSLSSHSLVYLIIPYRHKNIIPNIKKIGRNKFIVNLALKLL